MIRVLGERFAFGFSAIGNFYFMKAVKKLHTGSNVSGVGNYGFYSDGAKK
jgi:hypothetical protein